LDLISIASFNNAGEANLFRSHLKSVGIDSFLEEDSAPAHLSLALFRVSIAKTDLPSIRQFLGGDTLQLQSTEVEDASCPACGSARTAPDHQPSSFLATLLSKTDDTRRRCLDCERPFRLTSR
jgi:hypothetical protein